MEINKTVIVVSHLFLYYLTYIDENLGFIKCGEFFFSKRGKITFNIYLVYIFDTKYCSIIENNRLMLFRAIILFIAINVRSEPKMQEECHEMLL